MVHAGHQGGDPRSGPRPAGHVCRGEEEAAGAPAAGLRQGGPRYCPCVHDVMRAVFSTAGDVVSKKRNSLKMLAKHFFNRNLFKKKITRRSLTFSRYDACSHYLLIISNTLTSILLLQVIKSVQSVTEVACRDY